MNDRTLMQLAYAAYWEGSEDILKNTRYDPFVSTGHWERAIRAVRNAVIEECATALQDEDLNANDPGDILRRMKSQ